MVTMWKEVSTVFISNNLVQDVSINMRFPCEMTKVLFLLNMFDTLTHTAHFVASLLTLCGLTDGYRLEI